MGHFNVAKGAEARSLWQTESWEMRSDQGKRRFPSQFIDQSRSFPMVKRFTLSAMRSSSNCSTDSSVIDWPRPKISTAYKLW